MTRVVDTVVVDDDELEAYLRPRDDVVVEQADGDGAFVVAHGPFDEYRRTVAVAPAGDGRSEVTQTIDFRLAIPVWGVLFRGVVKRALRRPPATAADGEPVSPPWWSPPDQFDARAARVLSLTCVLSYFAGYMGTLMTQTNTYFKDEFGASNGDISWVLTSVRIGALLALFVTALADRRGRRTILGFAVIAGSVLTVFGGLAPGLVVLGVSQAFARAFSQTTDTLARVYAAEEVPSGSRAFTVSVLAMTGALGAGNAVIALSLADLGPQAWRILFFVPVLFVWPAWRIYRSLPESNRYLVHEAHERRGDDFEHTAPPALQVEEKRVHLRRFAILGATAFLLAMFFTPQSNYMNEYLRDEQGFSAGGLVLFQILTNLPGGLGIVIGGRLADQRGRRMVATVALVVGVSANLMIFFGTGWQIWAVSTVSALVGAAVVPALGVYGPELFPTGSRSLANGGLTLLGVLGAVAGLQIVGQLSDRWGELGPPIALTALGPLIVVFLVLTVYPETAHRSLEELNPEDDLPPVPPAEIDAIEQEVLHEHHGLLGHRHHGAAPADE